MVARGKPAPDLFLYATQRLAAVPDRCLVIEDSPAGIDAAIAAGMTAIGFCGGSHCGLGHGARLREHGAALVIDGMCQLANAMAKLTPAPARRHRYSGVRSELSMPVFGIDRLGRREGIPDRRRRGLRLRLGKSAPEDA